MIPKSFSASALQVAELCLARYKAEHIDRAPGMSGTAANVGTTCHNTFEKFVKEYAITKRIEWDEDEFWKMFNESYDEVFGPDRNKDEYKDAHNLCSDWFHREGQKEKIDSCKVVSVESKNSFPMKNPTGEIPMNYIMDRLDRLSETEYRVVDYKSQRAPFTAEQMRKKMQARIYALATQIKFPNAQSIWVEFDFLRHRPVAIEFKKSDNVDTYRMLQRAVRRILDTEESHVTETLNPECGWCIRKSSCKSLLSNAAAGGIMGKTIDELAVLFSIVKSQETARSYLLSEIESLLMVHAANLDSLEFTTDRTRVSLDSKSRRQPNHEEIRRILGPELAGTNGTFRVADIDRLIKEKKVDAATADKLRRAMPSTPNDLSVKVEITL